MAGIEGPVRERRTSAEGSGRRAGGHPGGDRGAWRGGAQNKVTKVATFPLHGCERRSTRASCPESFWLHSVDTIECEVIQVRCGY
jgi:hypothetical protein